MDENNVIVTEDETGTEIVETEGSGNDLVKVGIGAGVATLSIAAIYGISRVVKKGVGAWKRSKLKKRVREDIDYDEEVRKIHEEDVEDEEMTEE